MAANQNPFVYDSGNDYLNRHIVITVPWNATTRAVQGCTVVRDVGCLYRVILIGLGPDGTPDTSPMQFAVPEGTTTFTANQMNHVGITTIDDILAQQITAGF